MICQRLRKVESLKTIHAAVTLQIGRRSVVPGFRVWREFGPISFINPRSSAGGTAVCRGY